MIALQLAEKVARELQSFQAKLIETAYESCRARLARLLLALAERYGTVEGAIQAQISRTDLAEMAGISTETAIRTLGEFEERGLIALKRRKIMIVNRAGLEEIAAPLAAEPLENLL
jgi:CRP-like cAMP-binding protein